MKANLAEFSHARNWITGYGCTSAAGGTTADYWDALCRGADLSSPVDTARWPVQVNFEPKACLWQNRAGLLAQLLVAWKQVRAETLDGGQPLGVILASTKGLIEDFVWKKTAAEQQCDPLAPLLERFLIETGLQPVRTICISNACASSLSALFLAQQWLAQGSVSKVLILAADQVGPFVALGFQSLRALTSTHARPFDRNRDGLQLGEAAAALVLSATPSSPESHELLPVGLDAEGFAVTRPSLSGDSLARACVMIPELREAAPQLIIAHGTGTVLNDQTEDQVFTRLFEASTEKPDITATKWCIGHTLGASGAMDMIAACRVLETQKVFHLANTREVDASFRGSYRAARDANPNWSQTERVVQRILITSLGFGGVHAAAVLQKSVVQP